MVSARAEAPMAATTTASETSSNILSILGGSTDSSFLAGSHVVDELRSVDNSCWAYRDLRRTQEVVIVFAQSRRRLGGGCAERGVAGRCADQGDSVLAAADLKREVVLGEQRRIDDLLPGVGQAGHYPVAAQQFYPLGGRFGGQRRLQFVG